MRAAYRLGRSSTALAVFYLKLKIFQGEAYPIGARGLSIADLFLIIRNDFSCAVTSIVFRAHESFPSFWSSLSGQISESLVVVPGACLMSS
jgi:hypothetical protein